MQTPQLAGFSLSSVAIRRHIATLMLTISVLVLGAFFITKLQVDLLPAITYPRIAVQLNAPGISPEVAVDEITKPLEESLATTEGAIQIFSRTQEGRVRVDLFFQPGSNIDRALNDATATFNRGRSRLPNTIEDPRIFKFDPSQQPVYELALTSPDLQPAELRVFADEELGRELSVVPGVAAVDVSGAVKEEVQVNIDLQRLQAIGVTLSDVLTALKERNQDISGGRIEGKDFEPLTRLVGRFREAREIENLSFTVKNGLSNGNQTASERRVYLRDFAEVIDGTEEQRLSVLLNGKPAVKVSIQKQPDANTVDVVEAVKKRLGTLKQSGLIAANMSLIPTLDESKFIRTSIENVTSSGLSGTVLAAIAVFFFLGSLRQTLIIVLSIPLSSLIAVICMQLFGLSLNLFSLGGLALGVGIVVDNSIVMLENISVGVAKAKQQRDSNLSSEAAINAAEESSREVESAIIGGTTTNLVSVLPFLLIGGFVSLLFNELILTITFAQAASILVAFTMVPMMASRLLGLPVASNISNFWLLRKFQQRFNYLTLRYARLLPIALRYRLLVIVLAFAILGGGSLLMAGQISQEILPRVNTGQADLSAQFPPGTTLETNRKVMSMVDDILLKQPETEYVFTTVGGSIFGNNTTENPLRSSSTITLKSDTNVQNYTERVSSEFAKLNLAGIRLRLNPGRVRGLILTNSPAPGSDLDVTLQGNDDQELRRAGRELLTVLESNVKGANFRPNGEDRQPEVQIHPNWERLQSLGLSAQDVGETIQTALTGSIPTQLQRGNRLVDVRVQLAKESIQRPSQLERLPLFVENNRQIQLADVARVDDGQAPGEIQRINQRQVFIAVGNLNKGDSLSTAIAQTNAALANLDLPEGITVLPSTASESNQQLQDALKLLGLLASFLVFVVMAVQYNSLIDPLIIMFTVPLALSGGILGLYVTGTAIGATVIVGAVLLVGIVVNAAIIMVEKANQIRQEQRCSRTRAILIAAPQRLRPILMTTLSTVLGIFPLALGIGEGSEFLQPLGVVVLFGLSLATLLTLFVIPCFYILLHEFSLPKFKLPLIQTLKGSSRLGN